MCWCLLPRVVACVNGTAKNPGTAVSGWVILYKQRHEYPSMLPKQAICTESVDHQEVAQNGGVLPHTNNLIVGASRAVLLLLTSHRPSTRSYSSGIDEETGTLAEQHGPLTIRL